MKQFDFDHPDFLKNSLMRQDFLRNNYDKPITEQQYINEVLSWPRNKLHASRTRSPSASKWHYRQLVKNFGFFPGGQK